MGDLMQVDKYADSQFNPVDIRMRFLDFQKFADFSVKVAFVGDIMQHDKQLQFEKDREFSYKGVFDQTQKVFRGCDLVVGNLETVIGNEIAGFPKFSVPSPFVNALKRAGFNVLVTSNNHSLDQGEKGVVDTHRAIVNAGMIPIGTLGDSHKTFEIRGIKLTIHACTTFVNADKKSKLVSMWSQKIDLREGINLAYIHAGKEYSSSSTAEQKEIVKILKEKGFAGVLFTHSHVPGKLEFEGNFFVIYGMGNFISDQKNLKIEKGNCAIVELTHSGVKKIEMIETSSVVKDSGETIVKFGK